MLRSNLKVVCIFTEPAQYTIDLIKNVHSKLEIPQYFLKKKSLVHDEKFHLEILSLKDVYNIALSYDLIIINGLNNRFFLMFWFIRLLKLAKYSLALESDTVYLKSTRPKRLLKKIFFYPRFMVGLSGGNFSHRDYFLKHGIDKSRVFTLPMVVNNQRFEHLKVSCFHPEGVVKFIYIGNLIPLKRVDKIISAFIELPFENCSLMIIGDGPEEEKLKRLARDDERIVFKGRVENRKIGQYLSKSHYLVLASIKEMWGLVINEALASGTIPLISKNVGCKDDFSHLLEDWMVFDGEDFFSIVECFIKAVKFDEYTATAEKAQRFMIENWNYNLYINNLLHALEQIEMLRKRGL